MKKHLGSLLLYSPIMIADATIVENNLSLVDTVNSYPDTALTLISFAPYLYGTLFFLAGFLAARYNLFGILKRPSKRENPYHDSIQRCTDAKSLLQLLLSHEDKKADESIKALEEALYHDKQIDLEAIKERLLKA